MTPKELLYVEDALSHSNQLQTICKDFSSQLSDADLKHFVSELSEHHSENFNRFLNLLK